MILRSTRDRNGPAAAPGHRGLRVQRPSAQRRRAAPPPTCRAAGASGAPAGAAAPRRPAGAAALGVFVCSGSTAVAEALAVSGLDFVVIDAQHGAVSYRSLHDLLAATWGRGAKRIVRVGGPDDAYGMQQALDLGADGVMVPLVYTRADAARAVAACKYAPAGRRSVAYPVRAVYSKGAGPAALAEYLRTANDETEVWVQVETKECFEDIDNVLSVPGIHCAFLGPADLGVAHGLHVAADYSLGKMLATPEVGAFYTRVLAACRRARVAAGAFCLGRARAAELAAMGYDYVGFDTDLNALITTAQAAVAEISGSGGGGGGAA
ncbi:2,4-dihydroxyhept-2-ene-1,7-dioic acid aldolase [Raphidocelis subcapitata]|uniref:2,4-dihydroxyhept-2-ene-1,7-dioic acid aldolase n=1 Tax=Raphidocelis subcapitata TaxID=307507 RepID=A0A2V0P0X7_9CHLO|nr:2,4-dihydroxyhept-2-ene-1,7-dioic acid aldolase [Raphidocelis subcapitata]|eukprot:GBF93514.1 2,4-dihydroxyhept-2-ene-1,7-dioic acid aldolase [Raphidocelis subcapitata]